MARIAGGSGETLHIGNLDAKRDWGYAGDYVEAMWLMLQQAEPEDFVIATGETHSVRELIEAALDRVSIDVRWEGSAEDEVGVDASSGRVLVRIDSRYFRPTDVEFLIGDASKAREKLGWKPRVMFTELVNMMVDAEVEALR